ncbi:MAG: plastocyanin/azurin family copper-binding protein [Acidimicrobiia bacterium]
MSGARKLVWAGLLVGGVIAASMVPLQAAGGHTVAIQGKAFAPPDEVVGLGDVVVWTHSDGAAAHSVTSDATGTENDPFPFDSHPNCSAANTTACMKAGETFRVAFTRLGEFRYYSRPHGSPGGVGASGIIRVVPKGSSSTSFNAGRGSSSTMATGQAQR